MRYDVHYCSLMAMMRDDPDKLPGDTVPTLAEFDRYYRYVGTFEAANLNELIAKLQSGRCGLGDKTMQQYVIRLVQHTTIDNGDIAIEHDTGRIWLLVLQGWKQIDLK